MKAFIFDIDGVVLDTPHEESWRQALKEFGYELSSDIYHEYVAGKARLVGAESVFDYFNIDKGKNNEEVVKSAELKQKMIEKAVIDKNFKVYDNTIKLLLEAKKAGLKLAAASASRNAKDFLMQIPFSSGSLYDIFDVDMCGKDIPSKPAPDLFLAAAKGLGLEPSQCIVFEDAPSGIKSAKAGGFFAVGFASLGSKESLSEVGADITVDDLGELSVDKLKELIKSNLF